MQKTNKSVSKRIKVTGKGKLLKRTIGQNHFNARQTGATERGKRGFSAIASTDVPKMNDKMPFSH
ncbi:MAG: 50S ribosomal protein L35 [Candidatus Azambacteria bacterium]|nr:50S ribosomal protein L35 [Candidatus Azambacteria bacterium]